MPSASEKKSEEREKTTAKTTEIQEDEDDEENQLNATHRELREAENSIHRAVIDAARRTDRLERIERKSARLRGSAERFRENTRLLRQGVLERRRWHLFWAFLLCFTATLIFIALISWIIVAYTGAWDIEREIRNKRGCYKFLRKEKKKEKKKKKKWNGTKRRKRQKMTDERYRSVNACTGTCSFVITIRRGSKRPTDGSADGGSYFYPSPSSVSFGCCSGGCIGEKTETEDRDWGVPIPRVFCKILIKFP